MNLEQHIIAYAKQHEPQEICGFVVFEGREKVFMPCENVAADPCNYFEIHPDDWLRAHLSDGVVAVVHSHPNGSAVLSEADQRMQQQTALDWWLVCDETIRRFRPIAPLLGREFANQTADCLSLCRDAYMLSGQDFPFFDYEIDWYEQGEPRYSDNLAALGFEQITASELQLGDVVLMQAGAAVGNHAAIYLGDQQLLHHSPNRLSCRVIYGGYYLQITHSIWRYKQWSRLDFTAILNNLALTESPSV